MKRLGVLALLFAAAVPVLAGCAADDDDSGDDDNDDNEAGDDDDYDVWRPAPGTSWQWQLTGTIDASLDVAMYDVDLFDAPDGVLDALHADGRTVICYFSAGSYEEWRDDAGDFPGGALGNDLDGWEGERWLDVRSEAVRSLMEARLDVAAARGCDGVEPDNVDGYDNDTGFDLTAADQLAYNRFLADAAHARGLSVGLKNDVGQLGDLAGKFDWALNEECHVYDECDAYEEFLDRDKAVFNAEYVDDWSDAEALAADVCGDYPDLSTIIKEWDLTANRLGCEE
jgi:hypothetical protein